VKRVSSLVIVLLIGIVTAKAQVKFSLGGGIGLAYVASKNMQEKIMPFATPHGIAMIDIPIAKNTFLETGLEYEQKGFSAERRGYSDRQVNIFKSKRRYHYINLPLVVSYNIYKTKQSAFYAGVGMNYGFFIKGSVDNTAYGYVDGHMVSKEFYQASVYGMLPSSGFYSSSMHTNDMYFMDVMAHLQVRYIFKNRYWASIFYDHSLYDSHIGLPSPEGSSVKMRYLGTSLGIIF